MGMIDSFDKSKQLEIMKYALKLAVHGNNIVGNTCFHVNDSEQDRYEYFVNKSIIYYSNEDL